MIQGSAATNVTRGYVVLNGVKRDPIVAESSPAADKRPLWFVMTGMGAQWHEMQGRIVVDAWTFPRGMYRKRWVVVRFPVGLPPP